MKFPYFHIDAFASRIFSGNPAGVCFIDEWLEDGILQSVAAENCVSETAFVAPAGDHYDLRWFSPVMEIDLCGHATLASAHAIFRYINPGIDRVVFETRAGMLSVVLKDDLLIMDFPARPAEQCEPPTGIAQFLGAAPKETFCSRDLLAVFDSEEQIHRMSPDFSAIATLDYLGVIVTAPGKSSDFVSRFFAPRAGIPEDPVTGSAHCTLVPHWARVLGKKDLYALQLSRRGGELFCSDMDDRVAIGGRAVTYMSGTIDL